MSQSPETPALSPEKPRISCLFSPIKWFFCLEGRSSLASKASEYSGETGDQLPRLRRHCEGPREGLPEAGLPPEALMHTWGYPDPLEVPPSRAGSHDARQRPVAVRWVPNEARVPPRCLRVAAVCRRRADTLGIGNRISAGSDNLRSDKQNPCSGPAGLVGPDCVGGALKDQRDSGGWGEGTEGVSVRGDREAGGWQKPRGRLQASPQSRRRTSKDATAESAPLEGAKRHLDLDHFGPEISRGFGRWL